MTTQALPTLFVPHGAGPCFFMTWEPADAWSRMADWLRAVPERIGTRPKAVLVVSGHWEAPVFTVNAQRAPPLLYDYSGFPPHTYELTYPVPGSPALAERVQLAVSLVAPATLRGATFAAPRGSSAGSVVLPSADLGLGPVADVEFSFTALQVDTRGAAAGLSAASEYFDVTLSEHASLAPLDVREAPEPIALLIPLDPSLAANPEPSACNASEAAAGLCGVCDASDARLGRHNCSGHGTCVHGRCWCDALYRGPACLQRLECRYWSEPDEAWSSSGLRTDNSSAAGAAAMAEGLLRCESSHLTEFAGFSLPTSAEELLDEVQDLTLVLPCADGFFGAFEWQQVRVS